MDPETKPVGNVGQNTEPIVPKPDSVSKPRSLVRGTNLVIAVIVLIVVIVVVYFVVHEFNNHHVVSTYTTSDSKVVRYANGREVLTYHDGEVVSIAPNGKYTVIKPAPKAYVQSRYVPITPAKQNSAKPTTSG